MKSSSISTSPEPIKDLFREALLAREKSYSRYSGHKVGAAVRTRDGTIFPGCNVENSSYGATVCAERVAVFGAVTAKGPSLEIAEIMVVTDATPPWPPCGMCRQVLAEFGTGFTLHLANPAGMLETYTLEEIFPKAFTPTHMGKQ